MTDTARERIAAALQRFATFSVAELACNDIIAAIGIPESDLDGLVAGTHRVVPGCSRCNGAGIIHCVVTHHGERNRTWDETCPNCRGTGVLAAAQPKEKADG